MVMCAVEMAIWWRQGAWSVILHSDRGGQFRRGEYQDLLEQNTLICSMSAVGHCGDNASCAGFFAVLNRERVYQRKYRTLEIAKADAFNYIVRFHNPRMRRRLAKSDQAFSAVL